MDSSVTPVAAGDSAIAGRGDEPSNRREVIVLEAAKLFAAHGLAGVSMRDIAANVGFTMSALYHHFPGKVELYREVCVWAFEYVMRPAANILFSDGPLFDRLRRYVDGQVMLALENSPAIDIIHQELLMSPTGQDDYEAMFDGKGLDLTAVSFARIVEELAPAITRSISPLRLAEIAWDLTYAMVRNRAAHARLTASDEPGRMEADVSNEVWLIICKLLDIEP